MREIIALTPIEQILLETDAPFLTPIPYRGHKNELQIFTVYCRTSRQGQTHGFRNIIATSLAKQREYFLEWGLISTYA